MDLEKAQQIVQDTIEGRKRWGQMFYSEFNSDTLLDALVCLSEAVQESAGAVSREELTLVKRQLTASKAREAKLKKQIINLQEILAVREQEG